MALTRETARSVALDLQLESSARLRPVYFHGETMLPFLREGDRLIVEPVAFEDVRVGDVVTYREGDRYPTRRVTEIQPRRRVLVIRADNLPGRVFHVPAADLLGRVAARRRNGRWIRESDPEWRWTRLRARVVERMRWIARRIRRRS